MTSSRGNLMYGRQYQIQYELIKQYVTFNHNIFGEACIVLYLFEEKTKR